jgi:hypothetical protein
MNEKSASNVIDHLSRLNSQGFSDIDELDDIEPAFAALVLADEGLRTAQPFCQIDLRKLGFMSCANEGGAQFGVALAENGSCHAGTLNLLQDYPKIGYYPLELGGLASSIHQVFSSSEELANEKLQVRRAGYIFHWII